MSKNYQKGTCMNLLEY